MTNETKKAENIIIEKQQLINNIKGILEKVVLAEDDNIRVKIETKHWYGYSEPIMYKLKNKLYLDKGTLISILESAIARENKDIDKCIDIIIKERNKTND